MGLASFSFSIQSVSMPSYLPVSKQKKKVETKEPQIFTTPPPHLFSVTICVGCLLPQAVVEDFESEKWTLGYVSHKYFSCLS